MAPAWLLRLALPISNMQASQDAIDLIKASEGLCLTAYQDSVDCWTIGYGHTSGVYEGQTITEAEAEAFLKQDAQEAAKAVNDLVEVPLTQGQFDALVDWTFNFGRGKLASSTLLTFLNEGMYLEAGNQFKRWNHAGGVVLPGLTKRREKELELWIQV